VNALAELLALALFLGLDSFRASLGLASAGLVRAQPTRLALAFGTCDAAASVAGLALGGSLLAPVRGLLDGLGPLVLAGCAVYVVLARPSAPDSSAGDRWPIVGGVPLSLSLDNLLVGAALGVHGLPVAASALVLGVTSALLSLAGFALGRFVGGRLAVRTELAGAVLLLVAACSLAAEQL
jgi:manganese efflux pump family protein